MLIALNILLLDNASVDSKLSKSTREIVEWQQNAENKKLCRTTLSEDVEGHEFYKEISSSPLDNQNCTFEDKLDHEETPLLA